MQLSYPSLPHFPKYLTDYPINICKNLIITEPYHLNPLFFQEKTSPFIIFVLVIMTIAIYLNT